MTRAQVGEVDFSKEFDYIFEPRSDVKYGYDDSDDDFCKHWIHMHEDACKRECGHLLVECGDKRLGMIWAAVQVELSTYPRDRVVSPWLFSKFDMRDVVEGLRAIDDSILIRLVENRGVNAFSSFSHCGLFLKAEYPECAKREEV